MKTTVRNSEISGRGVFACKDFRKDSLIENSPVLLFPKKQVTFVRKTILMRYCFEWEEEKLALALGNGSLFNHSRNANAIYYMNYDKRLIEFRAFRSIKEGEEIMINYNGYPTNKGKVWFEKKKCG